jgi:hypothetical protein
MSDSHPRNPSIVLICESAAKMISFSLVHLLNEFSARISTDPGISIRKSEEHSANPSIL